jgi:hypothetical protein
MALGADFCRFVNRCAGVPLTACVPKQVQACEGLVGITAAEFAACHEAMEAATCQDPMPQSCLGIADEGRKPAARSPNPQQRDI